MVESTVQQRPRPMDVTTPFTPLGIAPADRVVAPPRFSRRDEFVEPEAVVGTLSARVIRKHRRVEARPTRLHDLRTQTPALMPEKPVVIERARPRLRTQEPPLEVGPRDRAGQLGSAVNVAQITDAVISQLDRRLIAARERRGKI
jgi:hypothetical protein